MDPERLDLSLMDPGHGDPVRRERLVRAIVAAALPELRRRALASSPFAWVARFARPALAAAALIALASVAVLHTMASSPLAPVAATAPPGVADALSVPAPVNAWLASDRGPTNRDVIAAIEGGTP